MAEKITNKNEFVSFEKDSAPKRADRKKTVKKQNETASRTKFVLSRDENPTITKTLVMQRRRRGITDFINLCFLRLPIYLRVTCNVTSMRY
jgi:hypothetical protein